MPFDASTFNKPWVKYSVIGIVTLGVAYIAYQHISSASGTATASSSAVDPGLVSLQEQQNSISAQSAQTASNQAYGLQLDAQQASEALQQSQLQASTAITEQSNQIGGTLSLANLQSQEQTSLAQINQQNIQTSLNAQTTQQQNNLATMVSLANITAGTQQAISNNQTSVANNQIASNTQIAAINAQTQQVISSNAAGVADTQSSNQSSSNMLGSLASLAPLALSFF